MTAYDERLRTALRQDPAPLAVEVFLDDVHRGARRRRTRRAVAGVVAGVAVMAVAAGVLSWVDGPSTQKPAPVVPSPVGLEGPQVMAPREDSAGRLYGLSTATEGCECSSILWGENEDGERRQVHAFGPDLNITLVELAPDPMFGFALDDAIDRKTWLRTSDGGRTWSEETQPLAEVQPPHGRGALYPPDVAYLDDHAYFLSVGETADEGRRLDHLWTTTLAGRITWQEPKVPVNPGELDEQVYSMGLVAVDASERGSGLAMLDPSGFAFTTGGSRWETVVRDRPCQDQQLSSYAAAGPETVFLECLVGTSGVQVFRSVNLGTYEAIGPVLPVGGGDDHVDLLLVDQRGSGAIALVRVNDQFVLLGPGSEQRTVVVPEAMASADLARGNVAVGHGDGRTYVLTTDGGVAFTNDAGFTWSELSP